MTTGFNKKAIVTSATTLLALVGFALPAAAADRVETTHGSAMPMSSLQATVLRNAPRQNDAIDAAPINEDVPASRSQIEVLDRSQVRGINKER